ncbi:hypothetical protein Drorol1_Dr00021783 [Drosera rotundifolia]
MKDTKGEDGVAQRKKKNMKKNMNRLGGVGGGLSLEAFASAKTRRNDHNPAILKKKREFYKNAKYVKKYKQQQKQQGGQNDQSFAEQSSKEHGDPDKMGNKNKKGPSLEELYKKKREELDKERSEREAMIKAKKEEQARAESRRKEWRQKMYKKTRKGQPVMKYRIEHLLETLQGSTRSIN